MFGAPVILQSDNGREFVAKIIEELAAMWTGLKIVHGKPRHPQSQGSVERSNQDTKLLIGILFNKKLSFNSSFLLH
jgi:transposase InsO family protein